MVNGSARTVGATVAEGWGLYPVHTTQALVANGSARTVGATVAGGWGLCPVPTTQALVAFSRTLVDAAVAAGWGLCPAPTAQALVVYGTWPRATLWGCGFGAEGTDGIGIVSEREGASPPVSNTPPALVCATVAMGWGL